MPRCPIAMAGLFPATLLVTALLLGGCASTPALFPIIPPVFSAVPAPPAPVSTGTEATTPIVAAQEAPLAPPSKQTIAQAQ